MRVVLDTNVYISAVSFGGVPLLVVRHAEKGNYELAVSEPIQREVERILCDKFGWSIDKVSEAFDPVWKIAHFVTPAEIVAASRDETDNRILECGAEACADFIVSGDRDLLDLVAFGNIRIVAPRQFLELL